MAGRAQKQSGGQGTSRRNVVARLQRAWGESLFYQAQLKGPAPDRFYHMPTDPRTPNKDVADMLIQGKLSIGSDTIDCEGELDQLWDLAPPGAMHTFLQDFSWLRAHHGAWRGGEGACASPPQRLA